MYGMVLALPPIVTKGAGHEKAATLRYQLCMAALFTPTDNRDGCEPFRLTVEFGKGI
jgi:hypothetical protein